MIIKNFKPEFGNANHQQALKLIGQATKLEKELLVRKVPGKVEDYKRLIRHINELISTPKRAD